MLPATCTGQHRDQGTVETSSMCWRHLAVQLVDPWAVRSSRDIALHKFLRLTKHKAQCEQMCKQLFLMKDGAQQWGTHHGTPISPKHHQLTLAGSCESSHVCCSVLLLHLSKLFSNIFTLGRAKTRKLIQAVLKRLLKYARPIWN